MISIDEAGSAGRAISPATCRVRLTPETGSRSSRRGSARRMVVRGLCASALGVLAWGATGATASASPVGLVQAPLQSATITGLRVGSQGPEVASLQRALIESGVAVAGGADGVFGPATRTAVENFQQARGLSVTGEVDATTAEALATAESGSGSMTSAGGAGAGSYVGLAEGSRGSAVTDVQRRLIDLGVYVAGGADGVYGPATTTAVKQFQRWNGLGVTGGVTEATARTLGLTGDGASTPPDPEPEPEPEVEPEIEFDSGTSANPYVGLQRGASGSLVKDLQQTLISTGLTVRGGADGSFGPATEAALKSFQRANGLVETGVVGSADAAALHLGAHGHGDEPEPESSSNPYIGLTVGSTGPLVKDLQQSLIDAGINVRGGADGVFGTATKGGLVLFQQQQGLPANGVVDQATTDALGLGAGGPVGFVNDDASPDPVPDDPPPASTGNAYVGLTVGDKGPLVKELQVALQDTGLVVRGGADGVFGAATKSSLIAFQSVNGIPQTGVVTEKGAGILGLGSGGSSGDDRQGAGSANTGGFQMLRFPVQGHCFFGDTWHAPRGGNRKHEGVDFIAPEGNLLYAVVDGEISKLYWDHPGALAGNGLRVAQDDGTYFTYLHLSSFAPGIELGTKVKAGDVIGYVGNTGSSATPHLHFEIHPGGGAAINPYPYVKAIDDCTNTTPQYQQSYASSGHQVAPADAEIGMSA